MPDYKNILTDTIYNLESSEGQNRAAYKPNRYKALGGFQLTPDAFSEVQKLNPQWKGQNFSTVATNDVLAREAASDYLKVLARQFSRLGIPLTNENLLLAYHSGAGNVKKGTIGKYGRQYQARARALAGIKPGEVW